MLTSLSVLYDAVFVPGGADSIEALSADSDAVHYIAEAFKHYKPIAVEGAGTALLEAAGIELDEVGVLQLGAASNGRDDSEWFVQALAQHRFWNRTGAEAMPA